MRHSLLALASVLAAVFPAKGSLAYTFSYTETSGSVQSFSFTMFSQAFIGPGTPAFTPFAITDGSTAITITQEVVGVSPGGTILFPAGDGCFGFGTPTVDLSMYMGCGWAVPANGPLPASALTIDIPGGLPSTTGVFPNLIFDGIAFTGSAPNGDAFYNCCDEPPTGSLRLTVSQVPEPRSFALGAIGVVMIGLILLARRCRRVKVRWARIAAG